MKLFSILLTSILFMTVMAHAATESSSALPQASFYEGLTAKNRVEALQTEAIYYSLPRADMSFMSLGTASQRQSFRNYGFDEAVIDEKVNNQLFSFFHSRGLNDEIALDFKVDYALRDENASTSRSSGVSRFVAGARSHFEMMDLNWVYGGGLAYLPDGEARASDSKTAFQGQIGFEESVDVALWGLGVEATTEDSALFNNQTNFVGFFEMPFMKSLNLGVSGGFDFMVMSEGHQSNFGKIYGQYTLDSVSAVQANLKQTNEKKSTTQTTDTEVGVSLNRVF